MDLLVVGSGLSGAIIANHFANKGKKVLILEKRKHIGGNIYDKTIYGVTVQAYGPHIFHTDSKRVYDYMNKFWKLNNFNNKVRANIKGKEVSIPFNWNSIKTFWPKEFNDIQEKLIEQFGKEKRVSVAEMMSQTDPILKKVANFIFKNVFLNYTIKMWDKKPEEIDPYVMSRVPMLTTGNDEKYFQNKYEGIPEKGYTSAIEKMLNHENIEIQLDTNAVNLIEIKNNKVFYNYEQVSIPVIYTGSLDQLLHYSEGHLNYRSLDIQFRTLKEKQFQKTAVVNYPSHPEFTRICEYKHFLSEKSDMTIISKEYPGNYKYKDERFDKPFYPFSDTKSKKQYQLYYDQIKNIKNFFPLGRLATYQYLDMDKAILNALDAIEEIENVI